MAAADQFIFVGGQAFQAHGPAGVKLTGGDAHLSAESVYKSVRKTGGYVPVNTGAVDPVHEFFGTGGVRCDDAVRMMGTETVDMINRFLKR